MYKLYLRTGACAVASLIALKEAGAEVETLFVHPDDEAWPAYLKVNPKGTVPALEVDGTVLTENIAIQTYVADRFPAAGLLPANDLDRARCLSLMAWFASTVHIARRQAFRPQFFAQDDKAYESVSADGAKKFWACLEAMDAALGDSDWFMGERFSLADGYAIVFYSWAVRDNYPVASLSALSAWKDRMLARPRTRAALEIEQNTLVQ